MEKTIPEERTVVMKRHMFYCDECGAFLGESYEYEDGYYKSIGHNVWYYQDKPCGWMYKKGNYCPECKEKVAEGIAAALRRLGFCRE